MMNYDYQNTEGPEDQMNRFKWIGNSMLRIMNTHGLELLVHIDYIDCDFKLLAYN